MKWVVKYCDNDDVAVLLYDTNAKPEKLINQFHIMSYWKNADGIHAANLTPQEIVQHIINTTPGTEMGTIEHIQSFKTTDADYPAFRESLKVIWEQINKHA